MWRCLATSKVSTLTMLFARILSTALMLTLVGCIEIALPKRNKAPTNPTLEGKRNTEPGNSLLDLDTVGGKAVIGKEPPNRLIAQDGTTCIVPVDKYEKMVLGASAVCVWSKTGR